MSRAETIAIITAGLASLDDARLQAVAEIVREAGDSEPLPRELTAEELRLIEQSKEDFRTGRTLSPAEARARTDHFLALRRAARAKQ